MTTRLELEVAATASVAEWTRRQLAQPKNRLKGLPSESVATLIRMAQQELDEALHALRERGPDAVLEELGDAAATIGLAMWKVGADNAK